MAEAAAVAGAANGGLEQEISAYQVQLRTRDEEDAVAGIACGNLYQVVQAWPPAPHALTLPAASSISQLQALRNKSDLGNFPLRETSPSCRPRLKETLAMGPGGGMTLRTMRGW